MKNVKDFLLNLSQNFKGDYLHYVPAMISYKALIGVIILKIFNLFLDRYKKKDEAVFISSLYKSKVLSYTDGKKKIEFKGNKKNEGVSS